MKFRTFGHELLQYFDGGGGGGIGRGSGTSAIKTNGQAMPTQTIKKSVAYVAGGADSNLVLSISGTDASDAIKSVIPNSIEITNSGVVPTIVISQYEGYSDEDTDAGRHTIQTMLMPNETFYPPTRGIIPTANQLRVLDGTVVDFTTTVGDTSNAMSDFESDSGDNVASGEFNNTTDPVVFELDNGHEKYRVGDYLRCENEIVRVEGTYEDNPTTSTVADNHIVVSRAHFGSTAAAHSGTPDIMFPCTNELYDFDRALSGSSQLVQSDMNGKFALSNFFGYGRTLAGSGTDVDNKTFGLVAGSVCFRFYSSAYQEIIMGGTTNNIPITSSTSSKLTASTAYAFNLVLDDSSATTISFTTDTSNVNFGGTNGVITKIQDAIDTATRTTGGGLYGYSCSVGIINGRLRFTSNSHLSPHDGTNGSKVLLADAGSGTNVLSGSAGIFPDDAVMNAPVKPIISPVSVYDTLTYAKSSNMGGMCYDNGWGELIYNGARVGSISYETGAFNFSIPSLPNAEFEISLAHGSPFAGKRDTTKEDTSTITAIHANVINKNITGEIEVKLY